MDPHLIDVDVLGRLEPWDPSSPLTPHFSKLLTPHLQLTAPASPRVQLLRTLVDLTRRLDEAPTSLPRAFAISANSRGVVVVVEAAAACPDAVARAAPGPAPLLAVRFAERGDDPADDAIDAPSPAAVAALVRALRANGRLRGGAADASFLAPPRAEAPPGALFVGLRCELVHMANGAYDGLRGVLTRRGADGRWNFLPTDVARALELRTVAERATGRADRTAPLAPLSIRPEKLRPLVPDARAPRARVPDVVSL